MRGRRLLRILGRRASLLDSIKCPTARCRPSSLTSKFPTPILFAVLLISAIGLASAPATTAHFDSSRESGCQVGTLPSSTFVASPPAGSKGPDDITLLAAHGLVYGRPLIWTAYQNGINPDGTPSSPGGPTQSTVAGYDPSTGVLERSIPVTGKIDGLTAWPSMGVLIATVNEDDNSGFDLVNPTSGSVTAFTYSPNPAVSGNGGTDSIAVRGDAIYVSHSNPNDVAQATTYRVSLDLSTRGATLTPVFFDDSPARDVTTGSTVQLALHDPDTNYLMPRAHERFAGTLATVSQADGELVFASHLGHSTHLWVLSLTDNVAGNAPPIDGLAVATSNHGTLYMVDSAANKIYALDTEGCPKGTVFVGEPNDNGNPLLGTLNLRTGHITPFGNAFQSPKGILFVPNHDDHGDR